MRLIPSTLATAAASHQRGATLFGLLLWAVGISAIAVLGLKVFPTVNEYITIQRAVDKIMATSPTSVPDIRRAFERQKEIEYSISTIGGSDLEIDATGEKIKVSFAYDKEIELVGPVFLLIKYRGGSR
jgi:hypothetical protein